MDRGTMERPECNTYSKIVKYPISTELLGDQASILDMITCVC